LLRIALVALAILSTLFPASSPAETHEVLRVGLTGRYPPFNFIDSNGRLAGFDVDIANELCQRTQRRCEFKVLQWDGMLAALGSGKIDAIIGSMAITPEREREALFTPPYYESGAQLFARINGPSPEAPGFRIGVTLGTTYGKFAREHFPKAEVRTYKGDTEAFQDAEAGRLDGIVTDLLVGSYLNQIRKGELHPSGAPLYLEKIGIPMRKTDVLLHRELSDALGELKASPRYSDLRSLYFGETSVISEKPHEGVNWEKAIPLVLKAWRSTLLISFQGVLIGLALSLLLASLLIFPPVLIQNIALFFVDVIRSTPFLIQLFAIYFGLPALGITLPAWWAGVFAIAIHLSAYMAETLKIAYQSIPVAQSQAAQTLGLRPVQTLRHVVFPQMLPLITVPALNTLVAMIKDSAIVSVISVHELTMQTQQLISSTFRPIEFYALAAILYAAIAYPLILIGRRAEAHYRRKGLLHA
jgi:His/Glu/Gln/Arg/opine family amino acid ABC transporter permease subunit